MEGCGEKGGYVCVCVGGGVQFNMGWGMGSLTFSSSEDTPSSEEEEDQRVCDRCQDQPAPAAAPPQGLPGLHHHITSS